MERSRLVRNQRQNHCDPSVLRNCLQIMGVRNYMHTELCLRLMLYGLVQRIKLCIWTGAQNDMSFPLSMHEAIAEKKKGEEKKSKKKE